MDGERDRDLLEVNELRLLGDVRVVSAPHIRIQHVKPNIVLITMKLLGLLFTVQCSCDDEAPPIFSDSSNRVARYTR